MGVLHPVAHRTQMTKKRLLKYLYFSALAILAMMLMAFVYKTLYYIFTTANICISLTLIAFVYIRILSTARRRFSLEIQPGHGKVGINSRGKNRKQQFVREFKLAKSCFFVIITFFFCFIPISVISVLSVNVSREMLPKFGLLQSWAITLALSNHSLNSLIFFWTRPMLKKEAKKVLKNIWADIEVC